MDMSQGLPLGASRFPIYRGSVSEFLRFCRERELTWVEVKAEPLDSFLKLLGSDLDEARAFAQQHGIGLSFHAPYRQVNLAALDTDERAEAVDRTRRCLEMAERLGAIHVAIHTGWVGWDETDRLQEAQIVSRETIESLAEEFSDLTLCVENGDPSSTRRQVAMTMEELDPYYTVHHNIRYTYDVGHLFLLNRRRLSSADPFTVHERIGLCHVHNNSGRVDEHRPTDRGAIDFGEFLRKYVRYRCAFPLVIEVNSLADIDATVEHLRSIYLR
ncbi:MAG: sugar phosphate isomerase/epimerase family protein [Candidatus Bipolaricaulia bacterium]